MIEWLRIFKKKKIVTPSNRVEICISGSGGQGIILAGIILAESSSLYEGKNAVQTQSYGPEARGGLCRIEVVISDGEIYYPKTISLDILLAMQQKALDSYIGKLKEGGTLIFDSTLIKRPPDNIKKYMVYSFPFTSIANRIGDIVAANMVALGALVAITKVVSLEAVKKSANGRVKKRFIDLDTKALMQGFEEAEKVLSEMNQ